jgi:porin
MRISFAVTGTRYGGQEEETMTRQHTARPRSFARCGAALTIIGGLSLAAFPAWAQHTPAQSTGGFGATPSEEIATPGMGPLFSAPFGSDHLFGDWGGARTWLLDHGINVELDYLTESAGNVTGGRSRGFDYAGQIGLEIDLDFAKIANLQGFSTHTMIVQGNGRNLSADYLGDSIGTVQEIYGGRGNVLAHMVYTYAEQELDNNRIDIAGGWMPVGTYFASSPLNCDFMNVLGCGNPHPLPNYPGEPDWPAANWGAQVRVRPTVSTYVMVGLFEVNPNNGGISGFSWGEPGATGVSVPVELGWVPRFGSDDLVGHYKFGFDEDSSSYANLLNDAAGRPTIISGNPAARVSGRREYYFLLDQMLVRMGPGETNGLIVLGGYVHADSAVSPLSDHAYAGWASSASFLGRTKDSFGMKFDYIKMSSALTQAQELELEFGQPLNGAGIGPAFGVQTHEETLEAEYTAAVYSGVTVMPDVQYIMRPGATTTFHNAWVLGVRTNIQF